MKPFAAIVVTVLCTSLLLLTCSDDPNPTPSPSPKGTTSRPSAPRPVIEPGLFLVGNDHGRLRPCGCAKPVLGGIVRRAAFFSHLTEEGRARSCILAFGSFIVEAGRQQELKLDGFLEALDDLGVPVIGMVDGDLQVGTRYWEDVLSQRAADAAPLVSLNLFRDDARIFRDHAVVTWGEHRLVVTTYVSPAKNIITEPGVQAVADPDVSALVAALKAEPRGRLVLYGTGTAKELRDFGRRSGLEEAAAGALYVIDGVADVPVVLERDGNVLTMEMGTKGRELARLAWPDGEAMDVFTLGDSWGSEKTAHEIFEFYRSSIDHEQLLVNAPRVGVAEGLYAGTRACGRCHEEAWYVWKGSRHAHAWAVLEASGDTLDPECVVCHVVDYGLDGGFDPTEVAPVNVQCEACHGPSQAHVEEPTVPTPRGKLGENFCYKCHDLDNSPEFEFGSHWARIRHK